MYICLQGGTSFVVRRPLAPNVCNNWAGSSIVGLLGWSIDCYYYWSSCSRWMWWRWLCCRWPLSTQIRETVFCVLRPLDTTNNYFRNLSRTQKKKNSCRKFRVSNGFTHKIVTKSRKRETKRRKTIIVTAEVRRSLFTTSSRIIRKSEYWIGNQFGRLFIHPFIRLFSFTVIETNTN